MTEITPFPDTGLGSIVSNTFGERYLFAINRNVFQATDAGTVFRQHFGDALFKENTLYIIAGTDSGLLYQYIKTRGIPKGSRYLCIELPEVLDHLINVDDLGDDLVITTPDNWQETAMQRMGIQDYAIQNRLEIIRSLGVVHGHYGQYLPFWRQLREETDALLKSYQTGINNRPFTLRQLENLTENEVSALCLKDIFKGKTAVLLAGGPSLDELLPWVRQNRGNLVVIAVSRISATLLNANIQPDICVSVDPYAINMQVSKEMLAFQDSSLLVNEFHLSSNLLSSWGGKKVFTGHRYPWTSPVEPDNLPSSVGSTVTNTAFSLAVQMGISQLILGGADFCFSQSGHTHASGSAEHALGSRPMHGDKRVETNSGKMADTHHVFLNAAKVINLQAADAVQRGCRVINPAAGAVRLSHIDHLPVEKIEITTLEIPAQEIINQSLPHTDSKTRSRFYEEILTELERVQTELAIVKEKSELALEYNRKIFSQGEHRERSEYNARLNQIEADLSSQYASTAKFIKNFGIFRFIPLLRRDSQIAEDIISNNELYFQANIDTVDELVPLLDLTRKRVINRLEEEKTEPDITCLIQQWRSDEQPARAIQWAKRRADYVSRLPPTQQKILHDFQDSFDDYMQSLNQQYLRTIEVDVRLDGLNARTREYFQCQDTEGLHRLQTNLKAYREPERAAPFMYLVEGYLAELDADETAAISAYQQITQGPAHIDALMRLFSLHIKQQDLEASVNALKKLSGISSVYTPMYADMLLATGNVESAVEIYTNYLLENPDDLDSVMKLGKIYYQYGATDGVKWAMNYILGKDPDNQTARAMLQSLQEQQSTKE